MSWKSEHLGRCTSASWESCRQFVGRWMDAQGDLATLRALTDPDRRPALQRVPSGREVMECEPTPFVLDPVEFLVVGSRCRSFWNDIGSFFPILGQVGALTCTPSFPRCWKVCVWGG